MGQNGVLQRGMSWDSANIWYSYSHSGGTAAEMTFCWNCRDGWRSLSAVLWMEAAMPEISKGTSQWEHSCGSRKLSRAELKRGLNVVLEVLVQVKWWTCACVDVITLNTLESCKAFQSLKQEWGRGICVPLMHSQSSKLSLGLCSSNQCPSHEHLSGELFWPCLWYLGWNFHVIPADCSYAT